MTAIEITKKTYSLIFSYYNTMLFKINLQSIKLSKYICTRQ